MFSLLINRIFLCIVYSDSESFVLQTKKPEFSMMLVRQCSRLLGYGHWRRSCTVLNNSLYQSNRHQTESKVIQSPFSDVQIPNCLLDEGIWGNLERWPDKYALVRRGGNTEQERIV